MAAVKKTFDIALDIADAGANREFTVVDGDNGNVLAILLTDGGYPVDLTGCRVIAVFSKSDGTACQDSYDADGGITLCGTLNNQVDIELLRVPWLPERWSASSRYTRIPAFPPSSPRQSSTLPAARLFFPAKR